MDAKKRVQKKDIIFLVIIIFLTIIPAVTINTKTQVRSLIDNKYLEEFPEVNKDFISGLNLYVNDRIGFRNESIYIYQLICDRAFDYLAHPLYEYGKEKWIMTDDWDPVQEFHLDVDDDFVNDYADFIDEARNISLNKGADFLFLLIPNKETVYPEYISAGYNIKEQATKSDKITSAFDERDIPYIYFFDSFMRLKDDIQLYNKKFDSGHWNQNGCFRANMEIYDYLIENFDSDIEKIDIDEYIVKEENQKYLDQSNFVINEKIPVYELKKTEYKTLTHGFWEDDPNMTFSHAPQLTVNNSLPDAPRLLVFGDSYFGDEMKYLGNHFSSVCIIHTNELAYYRRIVDMFDPDIVIIEATERVILPAKPFFRDIEL